MIDNIELIKPLLNFEQEGDFYILYVMKRKKDQDIPDNHQSVRVIKTYCITSIEHLEKRYEEIKILAELFQARVYMHVQKQNHKDVALDMLILLAERIKNNVHNQQHLFESIIGSVRVKEKRWIIDIDSKDPDLTKSCLEIINSCQPEGDKLIAVIPTKSGRHLITSTFNVDEFRKKAHMLPDIDIQKKNPTLLYFPDSLNK